MKTRKETVVDVDEWDKLVSETYGRPYSFQQQYGCRGRGNFILSVPCESLNEKEMNDSVPEIVNHARMGVKFQKWLERDPKQMLTGDGDGDTFSLGLWWERNFYPDIQTVANDLHEKCLIEAGNYLIIIDW